MENYIIIAILVAVVGGSFGYVLRAKRRGQKCIGCPHGKTCGGCCGGKK